MSLFPIKCPMKCPMKFAALCLLLFTLFSAETFAASLDTGFGDNGKVAVDLGSYGDQANAVLVQPDGKILVGGFTANSANLDFMLFRLLADGSLDSEFNFDGKVSTAIGSDDDEVFALALQPDGKILAAGYSSKDGSRDFALARYNSDGSLDPDFGTGGMAVKSVSDSDDEITGVAVQPDGKILLTGTALKDEGRVVVVGRYRSDGTVDDESFADKGFNLSAVGTDARAESLLLTQEGRILVAGTYSEKKKNEQQKTALMVLAYDENGDLDTSFGHQGVTVPLNGTVSSAGYGMTIRSDGSILVAGSVGENGERDGALFLFGEEGLPDTTFGEKGALVVDDDKDTVVYDVLATDEMIAATGVTVGEDGLRKSLLVTYTKDDGANSELLFQQQAAEAGPEIIDEDAAKDSEPIGRVETTEADHEDNYAFSLAVADAGSVVVAGASGSQDVSSASVRKYTVFQSNVTGSPSDSDTNSGNSSILTGDAEDVTRTTALIPGEILSKIGTVTERGVVFSVYPSPVLNGSSSSDSGDSSGAPSMSGLSPSGTVTETSVTLSVTTDVNATCKYTDSGSGMDYEQMSKDFDSTGGTSHSEPVSNLTDGQTYTYYVRCKNSASEVVNTTDGVISFTVKIQAEGDSSSTVNKNEVDTTSPSITAVNVEGDNEITAGIFRVDENDVASVTLNISTNEEATCSCYNAKKSSDSGEFVQTGTTSYIKTYELAVDTYTYYVSCVDSSDNTSESKKISFAVIPVVITDNTEDVGSGKDVVLSVSTDEKASCKYSDTSGQQYDSMTDFNPDEKKLLHKAKITGLSDKTYTYYARCEVTNSDGSVVDKSPIETEITFTVGLASQLTNQTIDLFASSSPMKTGLTTALESVGDLFVSTAMAQDTVTGTTTTADSTADTTNADTEDSNFLEEGNVEAGTGTGQFTAKLADLKPGTLFYARAYAVVNGATYYGNQISFRTEDSCFVATAAYGSIFHPAVQLLRDFRDRFMLDNPAGRSLVRLYYHYSPPLADIIRNSTVLRPVTRTLLMPIIGSAWLTMRFGWLWMLLPVAAMVLLSRFGMRTMNKERLR